MERYRQDSVGNSLSVLVLVGMLASLMLCAYAWWRPLANFPVLANSWIPILAGIGLVAALYLSIVEVNQLEAVCGPVGDCNAVQSSPYARLFGLIPVGFLGLAGFSVILGAWVLWRFGPGRLRTPAALALWGMSLVATLISSYLTFLEPFVIGATCAWCLSSAIAATLLLWASNPLALEARSGRAPTWRDV